MTSISKRVYIDKLDDIVKEYINTYHTTTKMKPADVKDNKYFDFEKEVNDKNPKFEVGDHVRISKCKNIFIKGYMPNCLEEIFIIKKIKNTVPWTMLLTILIVKKLLINFMKMNSKTLIKQSSEMERKRKGYDNSINSWIDKKGIV